MQVSHEGIHGNSIVHEGKSFSQHACYVEGHAVQGTAIVNSKSASVKLCESLLTSERMWNCRNTSFT